MLKEITKNVARTGHEDIDKAKKPTYNISVKAKKVSKPKVSSKSHPPSNFSKTTIFFIGLSALLMAAVLASLQNYWDMEARLTSHLRDSYSKVSKLEDEIKETQLNKTAATTKPYDYKSNVLTKKSFGTKEYMAYQLDEESYTDDGLDFVIESGNVIMAVSNFYGQDFTSNMLFDFVGTKMYVIDWKNNSLDVYNMVNDEPYYSKSIELPKYKTGSLYGIECEGSSCNLRTAFHQEAGCNLTFYPRTETFGTPTCGGGYSGEPYTPEKL